MNIPDSLKYSKEHEWVKVEGDTVTIGITDYAQNELGDIVHVEIFEDIDEVSKSDEVGSIETPKNVSEVYAPISGTITERNPLIADEPEIVKEDPYGKGWMLKMIIKDSSELDELMDAAAYAEFTGG